MTTRSEWIEQNKEVQASFDTAIALTNEVSEKLSEHIQLQDELHVLQQQMQSWKDHRFEIVVVGEFSTGKSTFINALLRKNVLPSKVTPTTATINFIRHIDEGPGHEVAVVNFSDGRKEEVSFDDLDEYVTEMSKEIAVSVEVHHVDIFIDSDYLKDGVVIVDTPGLQALHKEHEKITKDQIKRSHASIFLGNMEQLGKSTEFKFLKDLKSSIDRIFFIGNRLDGIPESEIDEVIASFEAHLRDNEYQKIPAENAKLYPVSALQALKARDNTVETRNWNDWTPEELLAASRFESFENKLENYLFNGEKAQDALEAPKQAILNHYARIKERLNNLQQAIDGDVDMETLQADKERLTQEIELRKLQLEEKVLRIENLFEDMIKANQDSYQSSFERNETALLSEIEGAISLEELEQDLGFELTQFYKAHDVLVQESLSELIASLNAAFNQEIGRNKIQIDVDVNEVATETKALNITFSEHKAVDIESIQEQVKMQVQAEQDELEEEIKAFQDYETKDRDYQRLERRLESERRMQAEDMRFKERMLESIPKTKQSYEYLGKKFLFVFKKKEKVDVVNEAYQEKAESLQEMQAQQRKLLQQKEMEVEDAIDEAHRAQGETSLTSRDEVRERRRELRQKEQSLLLEEIKTQSKRQERELNKEKRRIKRQIEDELRTMKKDYRNVLRGLDALSLAKDRISEHVQQLDQDLAAREQQLQEQTQLLEQSEAQKSHVTAVIEAANEQMASAEVDLI